MKKRNPGLGANASRVCPRPKRAEQDALRPDKCSQLRRLAMKPHEAHAKTKREAKPSEAQSMTSTTRGARPGSLSEVALLLWNKDAI